MQSKALPAKREVFGGRREGRILLSTAKVRNLLLICSSRYSHSILCNLSLHKLVFKAAIYTKRMMLFHNLRMAIITVLLLCCGNHVDSIMLKATSKL